MPFRARRHCALALVLLLTVGHSAGLQTIAWVGMFLEGVQTHRVLAALGSILDGAHPCALCKVARSLASAEAEADAAGAGAAGTDAHKAPLKSAPSTPQLWLIAELLPLPAAAVAASARLLAPLAAPPAGYAGEPPTPPPRAARS